VTTDAVAGGCSVAKAIGSAFSRQVPSRPRMRNLYLVPGPIPGRNSSHTPDEPSERIGVASPVQLSKSPHTRTPTAFGAHTANEVPVTGSFGPSWLRGCAPSTDHSRSCRPSPIRCRSMSPSVGSHRYGSSTTWVSAP
jgi:hypothetical protein